MANPLTKTLTCIRVASEGSLFNDHNHDIPSKDSMIPQKEEHDSSSGPGRGDSEKGIGMSELMNGFDASIKDEKTSKVGPAGIVIGYHRRGKLAAPSAL